MPIAALRDCLQDNFVLWLSAEMERRGWSLRQTAQRLGVSDTIMTQIVNGQMSPGADFCQRIALVFHLPPEEVLSRAGLVPLEPKELLLLREVICFSS